MSDTGRYKSVGVAASKTPINPYYARHCSLLNHLCGRCELGVQPFQKAWKTLDAEDAEVRRGRPNHYCPFHEKEWLEVAVCARVPGWITSTRPEWRRCLRRGDWSRPRRRDRESLHSRVCRFRLRLLLEVCLRPIPEDRLGVHLQGGRAMEDG